jgi:hypothetical protein
MIDRVKEIIKEVRGFHFHHEVTVEEAEAFKGSIETLVKNNISDKVAKALLHVGEWSYCQREDEYFRGSQFTYELYAFNRAELAKLLTQAYAQGLKDAPMVEGDFRG